MYCRVVPFKNVISLQQYQNCEHTRVLNTHMYYFLFRECFDHVPSSDGVTILCIYNLLDMGVSISLPFIRSPPPPPSLSQLIPILQSV